MLIGSGARDDVELSARAVAKFRIEVVIEQREFLDGIENQFCRRPGNAWVVMIQVPCGLGVSRL